MILAIPVIPISIIIFGFWVASVINETLDSNQFTTKQKQIIWFLIGCILVIVVCGGAWLLLTTSS